MSIVPETPNSMIGFVIAQAAMDKEQAIGYLYNKLCEVNNRVYGKQNRQKSALLALMVIHYGSKKFWRKLRQQLAPFERFSDSVYLWKLFLDAIENLAHNELGMPLA